LTRHGTPPHLHSSPTRRSSDLPNPSIEPSRPTADITAPPGTPGAASITTPSIKINGSMVSNDGISRTFCIAITATAQLTIVIVEPDKWMVAHSGTVKSATCGFTPLALVACSDTGIVAALDIVPRAVK